MSRWYLTFKAKDPRNLKGHWETGIHEADFKRIRLFGHASRVARIQLVQYVLEEDTQLIFRGWSRPDKEDCYVYAGRPDRDYRALNIETPPPPEMMFLVFVLPDGIIDDWNWRPSRVQKGMPDGVNGELIWPPTQSS
jgi:hypothetical protein